MGVYLPDPTPSNPTLAFVVALIDGFLVQLFNQVGGIEIDADDGDGPRSNYDAEAKGFVWYDSTIETWYQKKSAASADWSQGVQFTGGSLLNIVEDTSPQFGANADLQAFDLNGSGGKINLTSSAASFLAQLLTSTNAGALSGPIAELYRNSASPAAADLLGELLFSGENSAGAKKTFAQIIAVNEDPTDTSEDGGIDFKTLLAGTIATMLDLRSGGLRIGGANARVNKILDEDDMASDDAAALATQQSIKAFVETRVKISTGTYTGDGNATQTITGVGFQPKFVWITERHTTEATAYSYMTYDVMNDDMAGGAALYFVTTVTTMEEDTIVSLDSDGFTVGDGGFSGRPNINAAEYNYVVIG